MWPQGSLCVLLQGGSAGGSASLVPMSSLLPGCEFPKGSEGRKLGISKQTSYLSMNKESHLSQQAWGTKLRKTSIIIIIVLIIITVTTNGLQRVSRCLHCFISYSNHLTKEGSRPLRSAAPSRRPPTEQQVAEGLETPGGSSGPAAALDHCFHLPCWP